MKKLVAFLLVTVMCLSLCACGDQTKAVDKQLQGTWEDSTGVIYTFAEGRFTCEAKLFGVSLGVREGDYEITDRSVALYFDNGADELLEYTYAEKELTLHGMKKIG